MNPAIVYCSTSGYGQTGPRSQWAGHDLNYLAVGGYLDCSGRDADGGPALPGATIGDAAGGGMQAVIAILAALVQRAATGEGAYLDVSVADGVVALMSLYIDEYLATGEVPGPAPQHPHRSLRVLRRVPLRRRPLDRGRRDRAALLREPVPRARLRAVARAPDRRRGAGRDPRRLPRRVRDAGRATSGSRELGPADTCVSEVASVPELVHDAHLRGRATCSSRRPRRRTATFEQVGWVLAGMDRDQPGPVVRDATVTDTDALLGEVGYSAAEIAALREEGVAA